jgi:hypothetical protein
LWINVFELKKRRLDALDDGWIYLMNRIALKLGQISFFEEFFFFDICCNFFAFSENQWDSNQCLQICDYNCNSESTAVSLLSYEGLF